MTQPTYADRNDPFYAPFGTLEEETAFETWYKTAGGGFDRRQAYDAGAEAAGKQSHTSGFEQAMSTLVKGEFTRKALFLAGYRQTEKP